MYSERSLWVFSALCTVTLAVPLSTRAAQNNSLLYVGAGIGAGVLLSQLLNNSANNACTSCQMQNPSAPNYCPNISCSQQTSGYTVSGNCGAPGQCRGTRAQGLDGTIIALGVALASGLISQSLQQKAQQAQQAPTYAPTAGCTRYSNTTQPSGDPCAIHNPTPVSETVAQTPFPNFSDSKFSSDSSPSGKENGSIGDALLKITASDAPSASASGTASTTLNAELQKGTSLTPRPAQTDAPAASEAVGGIREGGFGTTFIANLKGGFGEVAGFFGTNGRQPLLSRLCAARPWATGAIARIIAPSFFDALCRRIGFQVGVIDRQAAPPQGIVAGAPPSTAIKKPASARPGSVDIWAEPPSVRLGTRAKIFWRSSNVNSCAISGPSFEENSLMGGGTTVPIIGATVFTITCMLSDGASVSDSVTVTIGI